MRGRDADVRVIAIAFWAGLAAVEVLFVERRCRIESPFEAKRFTTRMIYAVAPRFSARVCRALHGRRPWRLVVSDREGMRAV